MKRSTVLLAVVFCLGIFLSVTAWTLALEPEPPKRVLQRMTGTVVDTTETDMTTSRFWIPVSMITKISPLALEPLMHSMAHLSQM